MERTERWRAECIGGEGWNIYHDCEELPENWEDRRRALQAIAHVRLHGTWEETANDAKRIARVPEMEQRIEELEERLDELNEQLRIAQEEAK